MLKVLLVSYMNAGAPTGVRVYYERLQERLCAIGHDTCIITENKSSWCWQKITGALRRLLSVGGNADRRLFAFEIKCFLRVYQACRASPFRPDIIHAQDPGSAVAAAMAYRWRIPVVVSCHFNDHPVVELSFRCGNDHPVVELSFRCGIEPTALPLLSRWYRGLFGKLHHFICVSEYVKAKMVSTIPATRKVAVIPNGVDFAAMAAQRPAPDLTTRFGNLLPVINVGHLEKRKNQLQILDVAALVESRDIVFWLVGDGEDREMLETAIQARHLQEKVILLGERKDVSAVLHAGFLYLHTALNDNCPLVMLEAMACGLPAFAVATGGIPELVATTHREALFDRGIEARAIAKRIDAYACNPQEAHVLAQRQFDFGKRLFDITIMTQKTVAVYRETIALHR